MVILPVLDWPSVADQGRAAVLYVSNIVFAREATDYFGGDITTSAGAQSGPAAFAQAGVTPSAGTTEVTTPPPPDGPK